MTVKTEQLDEATLITEAMNGDRLAYEHLVKRHYQDVFRHAFYFLRNRDLAMDVSQEVFVRVHRHLKNFDKSRSLAGWLYHINRNLCRNIARGKRGKALVFSDLVAADNMPDFFDPDVTSGQANLEQIEQRQALWKAIGQLNPREQEVLLLKDIEQLRYAEIAEILDVPQGTVMSRLYHARKKLSALIKHANI